MARALLPRDIAGDNHSEMEVTPDPSDSFRSPVSLGPKCRLRRMRPRMIDARMTCPWKSVWTPSRRVQTTDECPENDSDNPFHRSHPYSAHLNR
jgi:hypothetical protein